MNFPKTLLKIKLINTWKTEGALDSPYDRMQYSMHLEAVRKLHRTIHRGEKKTLSNMK